MCICLFNCGKSKNSPTITFGSPRPHYDIKDEYKHFGSIHIDHDGMWVFFPLKDSQFGFWRNISYLLAKEKSQENTENIHQNKPHIFYEEEGDNMNELAEGLGSNYAGSFFITKDDNMYIYIWRDLGNSISKLNWEFFSYGGKPEKKEETQKHFCKFTHSSIRPRDAREGDLWMDLATRYVYKLTQIECIAPYTACAYRSHLGWVKEYQ